MADISKITLPNNEEYSLKDAAARTEIQNLKETKLDINSTQFDINNDGELIITIT